MSKSINLSLGRKRVDSALHKIFLVSAGAFVLMVVISISLIVYRLVLRSAHDSLEQKEITLNSQLSQQTEKQAKYVETKQRIGDVRRLITLRSPTTNRMRTVATLIPQNAEVNMLNGTEEEIDVSLESDDLSSLNQLIEERIAELAEDRQSGIQVVNMQRFGINPKTLRYTVSFSIKFD